MSLGLDEFDIEEVTMDLPAEKGGDPGSRDGDGALSRDEQELHTLLEGIELPKAKGTFRELAESLGEASIPDVPERLREVGVTTESFPITQALLKIWLAAPKNLLALLVEKGVPGARDLLERYDIGKAPDEQEIVTFIHWFALSQAEAFQHSSITDSHKLRLERRNSLLERRDSAVRLSYENERVSLRPPTSGSDLLISHIDGIRNLLGRAVLDLVAERVKASLMLYADAKKADSILKLKKAREGSMQNPLFSSDELCARGKEVSKKLAEDISNRRALVGAITEAFTGCPSLQTHEDPQLKAKILFCGIMEAASRWLEQADLCSANEAELLRRNADHLGKLIGLVKEEPYTISDKENLSTRRPNNFALRLLSEGIIGGESIIARKGIKIIEFGPGPHGRDSLFAFAPALEKVGGGSITLVEKDPLIFSNLVNTVNSVKNGQQDTFPHVELELTEGPMDLMAYLKAMKQRGEKADVMYCHSVLHYSDDDELRYVLRLMKECLAPGGHVIFLVKGPPTVYGQQGIVIEEIRAEWEKIGSPESKETIHEKEVTLGTDGQLRVLRHSRNLMEIASNAGFKTQKIATSMLENYEKDGLVQVAYELILAVEG